jgi:NitT/TauT family transport system permease protein
MKKISAWSMVKVVIGILIVWQLLAMVLRISFIPTPITVLANIADIFFSKLAVHLLTSLMRIFAGLVASVLIGVPLGLCMGYFSVWNKRLSPLIYFTYPIPKIALLPLVMLIFGLGEFSKIFMIMLIVVFQIIISMRDAVNAIPKETFYSMTSLGAGQAAIFRIVVVPASLPALLSSVRISLGTALSVLFFTETFGTQYGLGYFIMDSWMRVNYVDMFSGILILGILGLLLFGLADLIERLVCRWRTVGQSVLK